MTQTSAANDAVLHALTLGFSSDPIMRWIYPDPGTYLTAFPQVLRLFGGAAFTGDTAFLSDDHRAAAMWLAPGAHPDEEGLMAHFEATLAEDVLTDAFTMFEAMDKLHPSEPCWHLAFVATDPGARGRGLASSLIEKGLTRCDAEGKIAYLENTNPHNVGLYRRHGFEVIGEINVGDAPPLICMLREPR
ncbi:MAG: N-acetyltransferase [Pseudomonadota bacterium]